MIHGHTLLLMRACLGFLPSLNTVVAETVDVCIDFLKSLTHKMGHNLLARQRWQLFPPLLRMLAADELICCLPGLCVHELPPEEILLLPGGYKAA